MIHFFRSSIADLNLVQRAKHTLRRFAMRNIAMPGRPHAQCSVRTGNPTSPSDLIWLGSRLRRSQSECPPSYSAVGEIRVAPESR